jgi:ferredoxin
MPTVKFLDEKMEIQVPEGANLRREALKAGVPLYPGVFRVLNCRGLGSCGSCRVLVSDATLAGASPKGLKERIRLMVSFFQIGHEKNMRLACQTRIVGDLEVKTKPPFNLYGTQKIW